MTTKSMAVEISILEGVGFAKERYLFVLDHKFAKLFLSGESLDIKIGGYDDEAINIFQVTQDLPVSIGL